MAASDDVAAVAQLWYLGQETGNAVADLLVGDASPSGRLPTTFPRRYEDNPTLVNYPGEGGQVHYGENVFVGYRYYDLVGVDPRFPFGHGLGYTTFAIGRPVTDASPLAAGAEAVVEVDVTNTGERPGAEVVQLYVGDDEATVRRAPRELRAFAKVHLEPGASTTVRFVLGPRELAFWDTRAACWRAEPGTFSVWAGRSSRDLGEPAQVVLGEGWTAPAYGPTGGAGAVPIGGGRR